MKKLFSYMMVCGAMMTAVLGFTSCEDDLDVQQAYPFTVETMPVPKRLVQGETAEIRCEIVREGYFSDTRYTIRYFQPDGEGTLRMDDGMVLLPNDRYPLDRDVFRLYYTSECEDQQTIDVYFEDNHDPQAILQVLKEQFAIDEEGLISETARLLGYASVRDNVNASMKRGILYLLDNNQITSDNKKYKIIL